MITYGISANSHDAALAVFDNKKLVFASHAERFSGIKNDAHLNQDLLSYAMVNYGKADNVVWYENPIKKTIRQLWAGQGWRWRENHIPKYLADYGIHAPIEYASHHESHAAAGYFTSPYTDATVVCIDSIGEFETLSVWQAKGNQLRRRYSQGYPHSVGLWYSAMTQRIGLKPNEDEYILMGMAAYGDPNRLYADIKKDFFEVLQYCSPEIKLRHNLHRGWSRWRQDLKTEQDMFDIAAATQKIYEEILLDIVLWCKGNNSLPSKNLILMGGCALNCLANQLVHNVYNNVWIMPNPGDAGSAIGSVLAKWKTHIDWKSPYLGYSINKAYPTKEIIAELQSSGIVGVANGKAEYGPRALGNRSLLADPRGQEMKDRVNAIKHRQKFRPFAPVILKEEAHKFFEVEKGFDSPYMQRVVKCKYPDAYPAIVHADGTSRVQTVDKEDHPSLHKTLKLWQGKTGCPILLNTSLNIKGKPMVNDEADAEAFAKHYGVKVV
jgi:carbamoyltransferase